MHRAFTYVELMESMALDSPVACDSIKQLTADYDVTMTVDAVYVGDLAKDLQELFPADKRARTKRCSAAKHRLPPKRRVRNRKRSEKQKKVESEKRRIKLDISKDRRDNCLHQEFLLRLSIYACIHWCAESLGMVADASILPLLPHELREIMAKADAALQDYRGFSGQKTLIKQLNELPTWW